jgi:hypothetical protein
LFIGFFIAAFGSDNRLMCYYPQRQPNGFNRIKKGRFGQGLVQDLSDRELSMRLITFEDP